MEKLHQFKESLKHEVPEAGLPVQLKALWYDGKGDWNRAHEQVDHLDDRDSAHVHAYLHRKEGDLWNADYWYRKAQHLRPDVPLQEEWEDLVLRFL
ncbi:hypothetical protein C7T94_18270 [Pedobacter yulinensis]|uniref:Uncharacterized protein n=1 Tax=Pedobacter yulinensis TaxID=2126353 RepID=A0A2T3HH94_9SPHI|nr:hypothetical protein [Pedobacter yulinensis]PST81814.1 hypothetical protein C7T94_18270 [Pedobacter yulinensis]